MVLGSLCVGSSFQYDLFKIPHVLSQISESWSYPPLNDTAEAASRVREALAERGWRLRT